MSNQISAPFLYFNLSSNFRSSTEVLFMDKKSIFLLKNSLTQGKDVVYLGRLSNR